MLTVQATRGALGSGDPARLREGQPTKSSKTRQSKSCKWALHGRWPMWGRHSQKSWGPPASWMKEGAQAGGAQKTKYQGTVEGVSGRQQQEGRASLVDEP